MRFVSSEELFFQRLALSQEQFTVKGKREFFHCVSFRKLFSYKWIAIFFGNFMCDWILRSPYRDFYDQQEAELSSKNIHCGFFTVRDFSTENEKHSNLSLPQVYG